MGKEKLSEQEIQEKIEKSMESKASNKISELENQATSLTEKSRIEYNRFRDTEKQIDVLEKRLELEKEKYVSIENSRTKIKHKITILNHSSGLLDNADSVIGKYIRNKSGIYIKVLALKGTGYNANSYNIEKISVDSDFKNVQIKTDTVNLNTLSDMFNRGEEISKRTYINVKLKVLGILGSTSARIIYDGVNAKSMFRLLSSNLDKELSIPGNIGGYYELQQTGIYLAFDTTDGTEMYDENFDKESEAIKYANGKLATTLGGGRI